MFRRMPIDVLEISIDGERYEFQSPRDFEFALSGRICVPASKIAALSRLSDNELLREAEAIRAVEQRFAEAREIKWIRVERYWEGEFPDVKLNFIPMLCQQCDEAPSQ